MKDSTDYYLRKVLKLRKAAGMSCFSGDYCNHQLHRSLIKAEQKELGENPTVAEIADNIVDVLVYELGYHIDMCHSEYGMFGGYLGRLADAYVDDAEKCAKEHGINLREAFDLVHESNMSKLVISDEISETFMKYGADNVTMHEVEDGLFSVFAKRDFNHDGELIQMGKWLKSSGYFAPRWEETEDWLA